MMKDMEELQHEEMIPVTNFVALETALADALPMFSMDLIRFLTQFVPTLTVPEIVAMFASKETVGGRFITRYGFELRNYDKTTKIRAITCTQTSASPPSMSLTFHTSRQPNGLSQLHSEHEPEPEPEPGLELEHESDINYDEIFKQRTYGAHAALERKAINHLKRNCEDFTTISNTRIGLTASYDHTGRVLDLRISRLNAPCELHSQLKLTGLRPTWHMGKTNVVNEMLVAFLNCVGTHNIEVIYAFGYDVTNVDSCATHSLVHKLSWDHNGVIWQTSAPLFLFVEHEYQLGKCEIESD